MAKATSVRARVRAEMTDEIKETARRHLAEQGASNLSLRAVAREVGMVSSAVYRYFESRDALLTALIIDAYDALGDAAETADAGCNPSDLVGRFESVCIAVRLWGLTHPHEYALTYGSPVPGYAAPQDTVGPALRVPLVLGGIVMAGARAGILRAEAGDWLEPRVQAEMDRITATQFPGVPLPVMARGLVAWTELFGAVSFEVFGRLTNVIEDREAWFSYQVRTLTRLIGLRP
jgi:AcrR family transcriptional regulator